MKMTAYIACTVGRAAAFLSGSRNRRDGLDGDNCGALAAIGTRRRRWPEPPAPSPTYQIPAGGPTLLGIVNQEADALTAAQLFADLVNRLIGLFTGRLPGSCLVPARRMISDSRSGWTALPLRPEMPLTLRTLQRHRMDPHAKTFGDTKGLPHMPHPPRELIVNLSTSEPSVPQGSCFSNRPNPRRSATRTGNRPWAISPVSDAGQRVRESAPRSARA
jgi:hypothetical protein